ncbi:MAG: CmpA/NrtA family ABC transporter substrate-binding protein [Hyphomicrobium aestuarii]|nr:CmpA/NrtA family ABC transporter substrate-binding protein [Hyphomicrobium aestuarii]
MVNDANLIPVRAGFIPLIDCAPLIVAASEGFAAAHGIDLVLQRETSWANIRDKVAVGHLDVAHMLAPMPIAQNLGLGPLPAPMIAPMALGSGVNTMTVSRALQQDLAANGVTMTTSVGARARAIAELATVYAARPGGRLTFGIVHPHSMHFYELAYWLASAGLAPQRDYALAVVPPSLMADALASGQIDGFCVGEPWGSVAVSRGVGEILVTKNEIWAGGPEKVLGMRADWAMANETTLRAVLQAVYHACVWCDAPENAGRVAALLSAPQYLDQPGAVLERALQVPPDKTAPRPLRFAAQGATFPWVSHALWIYAQMLRFGQTEHGSAHIAAVSTTYRPDLYRSAIAPLGIAVPSANAKIEGALDAPSAVASANGRLFLGPDCFFDGRQFDPHALEAYLANPTA